MSDEQSKEAREGEKAAQAPEPRADGRALLEVAPDGTLRLTRPDGTTVEKVRLALAWPLRHRDRHVAVLDAAGKEVLMARDLKEFARECRALVRREIERRYLETRILSVLALRVERRVSYWEVRTDRGRREFVVQGSDTNPYRISPNHWLIIDVTGNRYQITDLAGLDAASRLLLEQLES